MSSMVSCSPPFSGSTNQSNDFFWMAMRFGTSSTLSRRAKVRRVRRASGEAKAGRLLGREVYGICSERCAGSSKARPSNVAQEFPYPWAGGSALTDPVLGAPVCGGRPVADGCDYRPIGRECTRRVKRSPFREPPHEAELVVSHERAPAAQAAIQRRERPQRPRPS